MANILTIRKSLISAVGYTTKQIEVSPRNILQLNGLQDTLNIDLKTVQLQTAELSGFVGMVVVAKKVLKKDTIATIARKLFSIPSFRISPNPARAGNNIQLHFKKPGTYYIELLDLNSRLISRSTSEILSANNTVDFTIPFSAIAGNYFVRVSDGKGGKGMVEKMMIY